MKKPTNFSFPKGTPGEQEMDVHADYINLLKHYGIYGSSTSNSVDITTVHGVFGEIKVRTNQLLRPAYPQVQSYADTLGHGHDVVFVACRTLAKIFRRNPDGTWPDYTQGVEYKMPQHAGTFARDLAKAHGGKKLLTFAEIKRLLLRTSASKYPNREKLAVALALLDCPSIQWSNTSVNFVLPTGVPVPPIDTLTPDEVQWLQGIAKAYTLRNGKQVRRALRFHFYEIKNISTKASNGQIYTPPELVSTVVDMVRPYVRPDHVFIDAAAGCGAFPGEFANAFPNPFESYDIDPWAVNILKYLNDGQQINATHLNSLTHAGRSHFHPGLRPTDSVIAVGNPPWKSDGAHSYSPTKGIRSMSRDEIHLSLRSSDMAISFLRQYAACDAEYIAMVMPGTLITKQGRYDELCFIKKESAQKFNYKLVEAKMFSSKEFKGVKGEFLCALALFKRGNPLPFDEMLRAANITHLDGAPFDTTNLNSFWIALNHNKKRSPIDIYLHSNLCGISDFCSKGNWSPTYKGKKQVAVTQGTLEDYSRLHAVKNYWRSAPITVPNRLRWSNARPPRLDGKASYYLIDAFLRYEGTSPRADQAFKFAINASQPDKRLGALWLSYVKAAPSNKAKVAEELLAETGAYIRKQIVRVSRT